MSSKTQVLNAADVKAALDLNNSLRDLAGDRDACVNHLLQGLCRILHGTTAVLTEVSQCHAGQQPKILSMTENGWLDGGQRRRFLGYSQEDIPHDPVVPPVLRQLEACGPAGRDGGNTLTFLRRELADDPTWYRSTHWNELRRPVQLDDSIYSIYRLPEPGHVMALCLIRAAEDGAFQDADRAIMGLLHDSIGWLHQTRHAPTRTSTAGLSRRQCDVLRHLMAGDSEKQAAFKLGLSRHTVHDHVKTLYRHFKVSSRGELMALFLAPSAAAAEPVVGKGQPAPIPAPTPAHPCTHHGLKTTTPQQS